MAGAGHFEMVTTFSWRPVTVHQPPKINFEAHLERNQRAAGLYGGRRSGLFDPGTICRFALRRRSAAHTAGDSDRLAPDGGAPFVWCALHLAACHGQRKIYENT